MAPEPPLTERDADQGRATARFADRNGREVHGLARAGVFDPLKVRVRAHLGHRPQNLGKASSARADQGDGRNFAKFRVDAATRQPDPGQPIKPQTAKIPPAAIRAKLPIKRRRTPVTTAAEVRTMAIWSAAAAFSKR